MATRPFIYLCIKITEILDYVISKSKIPVIYFVLIKYFVLNFLLKGIQVCVCVSLCVYINMQCVCVYVWAVKHWMELLVWVCGYLSMGF